ncbi:MAG: DUF6544 family protein [Xenococcaceae cyanobacterium]
MKALVLALVVVIVVLGVLIVNSLRHEIAVQKIWQSLKSKSTDTIFTPATIADLPEPVQKYFLNFIAPGTPLPHYVELEMSGNFRLKPDGEWMPIKASQIIATSGDFGFPAKIARGLVSFSGADYLHNGKGSVRFSLWGLIPLVNASNENITRSSRGRLAGESSLWRKLMQAGGLRNKIILNFLESESNKQNLLNHLLISKPQKKRYRK